MGFYVGIDLGTTNSTVSVINTKRATSSPLESLTTCPIYQCGNNGGELISDECLPSALFFNLDSRRVYTGRYAKNTYSSGNYPLQTAISIKTRIGNKGSRLTVPGIVNSSLTETFDMKQCSSFFIRTIVNSLKRQYPQLGDSITEECVVTVPAAFNDDERVATRNAVLLGGFKNCKILDEPTAALLSYINSDRGSLDDIEDDTVYKLVYDIGGGTLDVSIARLTLNDEGDYDVDIVGLSERMNLGGDNFDRLLGAYFLKEFESANPPISSRSKEDQGRIIARIVSNAELCKIELNEKILSCDSPRKLSRVRYGVDFELIDNMSVSDINLKKDTFDDLFRSYTSMNSTKFSLLAPVKTALRSSNLNASDISEVVLTGGMVNFYSVRETLAQFFGNVPINTVEDTRTAVSRGAALYHWGLDSNFSDDTRKLTTISNRLASNVYVHGSDGKFQLLIRSDLQEKSGTFKYKIVDDSVAYFPFYLYSGSGEDNIAEYVQLNGRMIRSRPEYKKGDEIPIRWSIDDDKVITVQIQGSEDIRLSSLMTAEEIQRDIVNGFKVNTEM